MSTIGLIFIKEISEKIEKEKTVLTPAQDHQDHPLPNHPKKGFNQCQQKFQLLNLPHHTAFHPPQMPLDIVDIHSQDHSYF